MPIQNNTYQTAQRKATTARILFYGTDGAGKAQPLDSLILTPKGWRRMGALEVGDEITSATGGKTRIVGIYPQGVQPVYRVTFNDGTSVECTNDHLWHTRTLSERDHRRQHPGSVRTLREIAETLKDRS